MATRPAGDAMNDESSDNRRPRMLDEICVERPRCPRCNGVQLRKYRSLADQGDGSALWWVECRNGSCAHRFRVLLE